MSDKRSRLVYSTDKAISRKETPPEKSGRGNTSPSHKQLAVRLEHKGRGGKTVTIIEGLQMRTREREALFKQLKTRLGAGGALKDAAVEIQGDHRDAIIAILEKMGHKAKRSGG